jgi:hypothetical protein
METILATPNAAQGTQLLVAFLDPEATHQASNSPCPWTLSL